MSLIDRVFVTNLKLVTQIKKVNVSIFVRDIDTFRHVTNDYLMLSMYIQDTIDKRKATTHLRREIHVIDNLKTKLLLSMNVMSFERMIVDMNLKQLIIKNCQSLIVKLEIIVKNNIRVRRTLRVEKKFIVEINIIAKLSIDLRDDSILDKDYLFELNFSNTYAHIVDVFVWFVYVKNDLNTSLEISRYAHMSQLVEFEKQDYYQINSKDHVWAINKNIRVDTFENNSQNKLANEMNVYDDFDEVIKLQSLVNEFVILWENTNKTINLFKNEWMTISLSSDWNSIHVSRINHKIYSFDERDRFVIDKKFDKLHEKSKMQWFFKFTSFEFSVFIV